MHLSLVFLIAIAVFVCYQIWSRNRDGAIARAIRTTKAISAVMAAYRDGDYRTALQKAESLKDGSSNTAEYCFFRGSMLHHLGKFDEAESNLREGLAFETDPRQRALVRIGLDGSRNGFRNQLHFLKMLVAPGPIGEQTIGVSRRFGCGRDVSFRRRSITLVRRLRLIDMRPE